MLKNNYTECKRNLPLHSITLCFPLNFPPTNPINVDPAKEIRMAARTPVIFRRSCTSVSLGASWIEIYCFIENHLNAGGLFYEVTTEERSLWKRLLWIVAIYSSSFSSIHFSFFSTRVREERRYDETEIERERECKLLLKLLTIRRSQIKIRRFFYRRCIVTIYCRLNAAISPKKKPRVGASFTRDSRAAISGLRQGKQVWR